MIPSDPDYTSRSALRRTKNGFPYEALSWGPYEVCSPKIKQARALNKCQWCKGRIVKDKEYLILCLVDRSGRKFHQKLKFCMGCVSHIYELKSHANFSVPADHRKKIETIFKSRVKGDRYNILLNKDPMKDYSNRMRAA